MSKVQNNIVEYLSVKDTFTDKTLQIIRKSLEQDYLVLIDGLEPEVVRKASIGRTIRKWMKEVKGGK